MASTSFCARSSAIAANGAPVELSASQRALLDFAPLWDNRLRGPRSDSRPDAARSVTLASAIGVAPATLNVKLLGTILEPGNTLAMFATPQGKIELRRVGEMVGGTATDVVKIQRREVVVRYQGKLVTLAVHGMKES